MKQITILLSAAAILLLAGCQKDLPTQLEFESYDFAGLDENGGDIQPVAIESVADIAVPVPADPGSAEYQAELEDALAQIASATGAQWSDVKQWTNNPVVRWNEAALELIAKYNLIPGPNADGSYTLPNPGNPDGPPAFPFAHPPYASRALAYMSVAQFDGLIAAWHHKFEHGRLAPYHYDERIDHAYADNLLPSYPSDGAVVASASRRILTAMFPLEAEYLAELEASHLTSLIVSGGHVKSDIDAGLIIGEAVATKALERAAGDGMRYAQCPKPVSDSIAEAARTRFGWEWINLELPQRPVGLTPLFGQVKMWSVDDVTLTRPGPPPAIGSAEYEADVALLKDYADNVTEERRRIANFWQDGLGTYTPPGHWNHLAHDHIVAYRLNPLRSARTLAYLNMAMMDGGISCWDAKYYYHYPRPIQTISGFKTIAGTPNFPSYTSGHSVFSAAAAEILGYVFPQDAAKFTAWAEEAAISRVYGGIHWSFDATVGTEQGRDVASYTLARARVDGAD